MICQNGMNLVCSQDCKYAFSTLQYAAVAVAALGGTSAAAVAAAAAAAASSPFLNGSLLINSLLSGGVAADLTKSGAPHVPNAPLIYPAAFSTPALSAGGITSRLSQQQHSPSAGIPSLAAAAEEGTVAAVVLGSGKTKSSSIADLRLKAKRHQEAILRGLSTSDDLGC